MMRFYLLSIIICDLLDIAKTLQIFNGTLTEITCSAAVPIYSLEKQERVYDSYVELPELFDIEARPSPTGKEVTLYINGTNRSNNVTVLCINVNISSGVANLTKIIIFTLILKFIGILPAPNDVHYNIEDPPGYLQILWEPPTLDSDELVSQNISFKRDLRIIHYTIYISTEESTTGVYNASETSFAIGIDKIPCSFWFQVAAVNPAGVGERSPPQNLTFDSHTGCIGSTSSTTIMIVEPIRASSGLSAGEITAVCVVLIITGLLVMFAIIFAKLKIDRHRCITRNLTSKLSDQLSKDSVAKIEKCVESDHCGSGNDHDTVNDNNQPSDSTPTETYSHDGPPECSYLYAEIDVVANKVPEPNFTEDTDHHVYAVLEQPSNQSTNTDMNEDDNHPADAQD